MPYLAAYATLKDIIAAVLHLSLDALHIHVGLVLFMLGAALFRTRHRYRNALILLLVVCVIGEIMDLLLDYRVGGRLRWLNSAKDIVNTMFWPAVCAMVAPLIGRVSHSGAPPEPEGRQATGTRNPIL